MGWHRFCNVLGSLFGPVCPPPHTLAFMTTGCSHSGPQHCYMCFCRNKLEHGFLLQAVVHTCFIPFLPLCPLSPSETRSEGQRHRPILQPSCSPDSHPLTSLLPSSYLTSHFDILHHSVLWGQVLAFSGGAFHLPVCYRTSPEASDIVALR